jgi:hypothetical protein
MKKQPVRRLDLKKKTITQLNEQGANQAQGGTLTTTSIIVMTAGCVTNTCATDITKTITSIRPPGTSV